MPSIGQLWSRISRQLGYKCIQRGAAINPGDSGGVLFNDKGLVIGINSSKISETGVEGIGFANLINDFISIINQLIQNGKIERLYVGSGFAGFKPHSAILSNCFIRIIFEFMPI